MKSGGGSGANEEEELLSQKWSLVDTGWCAGQTGAQMLQPVSFVETRRWNGSRRRPGAVCGEEEWARGLGALQTGKRFAHHGVDRGHV